jgi:membrane dipeptidase
MVDGHNDLLIFLRAKYQNHVYDPGFRDLFENGGLPQHVDLPRLDQGKQGGAFWSAFWPCPQVENGTDFSDNVYSSGKNTNRLASTIGTC